MKKDLKSEKVATIVSYGHYRDQPMIAIELSPGLPYDPDTKGMAHTKVCCVEVIMQNKKYKDRINTIVCGFTAKKHPDFSYIYRIVETDIDDLESVFEGYTIIDTVKQTKQDLAKQARLKLTDAELKALKDTL